MRHVPVAVALMVLAAGEGLAQEAVPPALELPSGVRVRVSTHASPGIWIGGVLASADAATIALVPDTAPPLGENRLRLPSQAVARMEILTGRRRQWLRGLLIGAAAGAALGFGMDVDPVQCTVDADYFCSRGGAVAAMAGTSAAIGALVGSLIGKDVWTPVALDTLGPRPARGRETGLGLRLVPGGLGAALFMTF